VLGEGSAKISRSRNTVTTPLYMDRISEIQRHQENTAVNSKSGWHCDYKLYYHV